MKETQNLEDYRWKFPSSSSLHSLVYISVLLTVYRDHLYKREENHVRRIKTQTFVRVT